MRMPAGRASSLAFMSTGDPYITVTDPTFVARFLLDPHADTVKTVANVNAFVDLPDGTTWALTIFTVDEVGRLRARWRRPARWRTAATSGPPTR
jgi:hypothetical protein